MDSIVADVVKAVDLWLEELSLREETINRLLHTRQRIQQILLQMQFEGELSSEIQQVGALWVDILILLADGRQDTATIEKKKKDLVQKVLLLLELDVISRHLAFSMITRVFL